MIDPPRQHARYLPAFAAYLLLALLVFAPVLPHLGDTLLGGPVAQRDAWQNVWNLWWVRRALANLQSPFYSDMLYYPEGVALHLQTLNISNGVLALPVTALFGPVAGYNVAALLAFALAGLGGFALAYHVSGSRAAAFAGGLLFTLSPFHLTKLWDGQLELIALQWLPFYALFLLRAAEGGRRRDALIAGVFLALIGYTSWYYFLFFALYSALFAALWAVFPPHGGREEMSGGGGVGRLRALMQLALAGLAGAALLTPILLPALGDVGLGGGSLGFLKRIHSADLLDLVLPSALHPLWGPAVTQVGARLHPYVAAWNISLGYGALALAAAALLLCWRRSWRWGALALASAVLALGPELQVAGVRTGIPMPYALLAAVPGVGIANRPNHFIVIAVVLLAPLAALGLRALLERATPAHRPWLLAIALGLLALELAPPAWPLFRASVHPYYATLARESGALMVLPPELESSEPLVAQMVHQRPIMGGFVSRTPTYLFAQETPGVRQLWAMRPDEGAALLERPGDGLAALNAYGLSQIVIHDSLLAPEERGELDAALAQVLGPASPEYADAELRVYRVPQAAPRPLAFFGRGWYGEERDGERRWRWMSAEGELRLLNPTGRAVAVNLAITAQSFAETRDVALRLGDASLGTWRVERGNTPISLRLLLPPGESRLSLRAPAAAEHGGAGRQLSIVIVAASLHYSDEQNG